MEAERVLKAREAALGRLSAAGVMGVSAEADRFYKCYAGAIAGNPHDSAGLVLTWELTCSLFNDRPGLLKAVDADFGKVVRAVAPEMADEAITLKEAPRKQEYGGIIRLGEGVLDEQAARIALCRGTGRSNPNGTALYIAGRIDTDRYVEEFGAYRYLADMRRLDEAVVGCIAAWQRDCGRLIIVNHMAVVTSLKPFLVAQRAGKFEGYISFSTPPFREDIPFDEVNKRYSVTDPPQSVSFYRPEASV